MNELVQLVQQKTGLSQEMSQKAVDTVVGYLKAKLPAPMASGLDQVMGGGTGDAAAAASTEGGGLADKAKSMMAGIGGMLGKKDS
jgi:hypothetical protein